MWHVCRVLVWLKKKGHHFWPILSPATRRCPRSRFTHLFFTCSDTVQLVYLDVKGTYFLWNSSTKYKARGHEVQAVERYRIKCLVSIAGWVLSTLWVVKRPMTNPHVQEILPTPLLFYCCVGGKLVRREQPWWQPVPTTGWVVRHVKWNS